jgi:hypothetical protein
MNVSDLKLIDEAIHALERYYSKLEKERGLENESNT